MRPLRTLSTQRRCRHAEKAQNPHRLLWAVCLQRWRHCCGHGSGCTTSSFAPHGGGSGPYTSDLECTWPSRNGAGSYSTVSLLIGPAWPALAGASARIAVLLAAFHQPAVAVFATTACALPCPCPRPARRWSVWWSPLTAVWMPRGGCWYQGTLLNSAIYLAYIYYARAFCTACWRCWPFTVSDRRCAMIWICVPTRSTVLLTVATSFKASLIFIRPALLDAADCQFMRTRAKI